MPMARQAGNWLHTYMKYTARTEPPRLFKLWCGISAIASVLERKVWMPLWDVNIYANMYIVIIGPSGSRKGTAMSPAIGLLNQVGINLSAKSTTREALIRKMKQVSTEFTDLKTDKSLSQDRQTDKPNLC